MIDLTKLVDLLAQVDAEVKRLQSEAGAPKEVKVEKDQPANNGIELVPITFEEVRTRLAELSRDGKTEQVRALITKFGASKLSDIDPKDYAALMDGAVDIEHGRA